MWHGFALAALALVAQAPVKTFPAGPGAKRPLVGDFDGDGVPDVVVLNSSSTISLLFGDGKDGFRPPISVSAPPSLLTLVAGDFNADGALDLAEIRESGLSKLALGDGLGGFLVSASFSLLGLVSTGPNPAAACTDVDHDGNLDLLVTGQRASAAVILGDGAGGIRTQTIVSMHGFPFGESYGGLILADLNGDGDLDLICLEKQSGPGATSVLIALRSRLGNGTASYGPLLTAFDFGTVTGVYQGDMAVVDMTLDGKPDLLLDLSVFPAQSGTPGAKAVRLLPGNGAGGFGSPTPLLDEFPTAVSDLDGDGIPELLSPTRTFSSLPSSALTVVRITAPGVVDGGTTHEGISPALGSVALADFTGDGRIDLVVDGFGSAIARIRGDGAGGFQGIPAFGPPGVETGYPSTTVSSIAAADFDGDGRIDLVAAGSSGVQLLRGDGAGSFLILPGLLPGAGVADVAGADLNGDGRPDLVFVNSSQNSVSVAISQGGGSFAPSVSSATGITPMGLAVGDLDGDGKIDVVTADSGAASLSILLNLGSGLLGPAAPLAVAAGPQSVALGDLNLDGRLDVAAACTTANAVVVRLALSAGGYGPPVNYALSGLRSVRIGDLNGDDRLDLTATFKPTIYSAISVAVFLGDGSGALLGPTFEPIDSGGPSALASAAILADLSADGIPDLVCEPPPPVFYPVPQMCVSISVGRGDGSFLPASRGILVFVTPSVFSAPAAADFDADGLLDYAAITGPLSVSAVLNRSIPPPGSSVSGMGTPGCAGVHGIHGNVEPYAGSSAFLVSVTNAPPRSLGLGLVSDTSLASGTNPFGLGIDLSLDVGSPTYFSYFDLFSGSDGLAVAPQAIPSSSTFVGVTLFTQVLWAWIGSCQPSTYFLSITPRLSTTIAP